MVNIPSSVWNMEEKKKTPSDVLRENHCFENVRRTRSRTCEEKKEQQGDGDGNKGGESEEPVITLPVLCSKKGMKGLILGSMAKQGDVIKSFTNNDRFTYSIKGKFW